MSSVQDVRLKMRAKSENKKGENMTDLSWRDKLVDAIIEAIASHTPFSATTARTMVLTTKSIDKTLEVLGRALVLNMDPMSVLRMPAQKDGPPRMDMRTEHPYLLNAGEIVRRQIRMRIIERHDAGDEIGEIALVEQYTALLREENIIKGVVFEADDIARKKETREEGV